MQWGETDMVNVQEIESGNVECQYSVFLVITVSVKENVEFHFDTEAALKISCKVYLKFFLILFFSYEKTQICIHY